MFEFKPDVNHCLICGSGNLDKFNANASDSNGDTVSITECKSCSFAWQYPFARTTQQSSTYFEEAYRDKGSTGSDYFSPARKQKIAELEFGFVSQLPINDSKRILDIGAGAGIFSKVAADNNWTVTAVDPSLNTDQIENSKITGFKGGLEKIPTNERYDVITMLDVIEHVENPADVIHGAIGHLDKNGWLVIETGNYKSAARIIGGLSHWIYQLDHRWYFSPESMVKVLKQAGFTQFTHCKKTLRPGWTGHQTYAGPSGFHLIKSIISKPLQLKQHVSTYIRLRHAKHWEMAGIEIFMLAARKP